MGRYTPGSDRGGNLTKPKTTVHPVWRGIGFVFMILIPLMSYGVASILLQQNGIHNWVAIPRDWLVKNFSDPLILVRLGITIFIILIFYAIFTFITFIINSAFGPSRYGPMDVPNQSTWGKKMRKR